MADDVRRLIEEREGHTLVGVWDVRSVRPDRLALLRSRHAREYYDAADHDRIVAEKDKRIAELERERDAENRVGRNCTALLVERTRERDEARAELADVSGALLDAGTVPCGAGHYAEGIRQLVAERDKARGTVAVMKACDADKVTHLESDLAALRAEQDALKDAVTAANEMAAAIRDVVWSTGLNREQCGDRTLVGLVRLLAQKLDEAKDNRRCEYELRTAAEADARALRDALRQMQEMMVEWAQSPDVDAVPLVCERLLPITAAALAEPSR